MFCNGRFILPTENVEQIIEEQWECARREPTLVSVYFVTEIDLGREQPKYITPHRTYCVFSREQAIRVAAEAYRAWQPIKPTENTISKTRVEIAFGNKILTKERILDEPIDRSLAKRFLRVVK